MYETIQEADLKALIDPELSMQKGPIAFIEQLDWKVPGIGPGKLVVIGAYVGSYKTLLAINMAYNNAIELGYNSRLPIARNVRTGDLTATYRAACGQPQVLQARPADHHVEAAGWEHEPG
ncbi:hypothetical protein MASR2M78_09770 [Treponema sp.]